MTKHHRVLLPAKPKQHMMIKTPSPTDILFGRGGESNNAAGNQRYQKVIEQQCRHYSSLVGRKPKTQLAWKIYQQLRAEGCRFLKREKGSRNWQEAPDEECRKKISQRLREMALEAKDKEKGIVRNGKEDGANDQMTMGPPTGQLTLFDLGEAARRISTVPPTPGMGMVEHHPRTSFLAPPPGFTSAPAYLYAAAANAKMQRVPRPDPPGERADTRKKQPMKVEPEESKFDDAPEDGSTEAV